MINYNKTKYTRNLTSLALILTLILLFLLSFLFIRSINNWRDFNQNQLTQQQLNNLIQAEYLFESRLQLITKDFVSEFTEPELLLNSPAFLIKYNQSTGAEEQIFRTSEQVIAKQLPTEFIAKITHYFEQNSPHELTCCGYTQISEENWARVGVTLVNEKTWVIYGELITSKNPIINQISLVNKGLENSSNNVLIQKNFFDNKQNIKLDIIPLNRVELYLKPLWLVLISLIILVCITLVAAFIVNRRNPKKELERLKQQVAKICPTQSEASHISADEGQDTAELAQSINLMLDELFTAKEFNRVVLNSIGDAVITTDLNGLVTFCNAATFQIIPLDEEQIIGKPLEDILPFVHSKDTVKLKQYLGELIRNHNSDSGSRHTHEFKRNLEILYVEKHITLLRDAGQKAVGTVMVLRDMTQSERLRKKLNFQASYDVVTKLYNRLKFEEMLNVALHTAKVEKREHILCQIDLDRFKLINDNAGHAAGDQLLYEIGSILRSFLRKTDVCARIGGDEYGIILYDAQIKHGLAIVEKIREHIKSYRFIWAGKVYSVGASFGITEITHESLSAAESRREVDAACYLAKSKGPNNIQLFDNKNEYLNTHHQAPQWAAKINDALIHNKFELFFQRINPTVGTSAREHVEILLRMRDENDILLPPGLFLPAAERFRLTNKIDRWVIKAVFTWLSSRQTIWEKVTLSINLSGESLNDESLYDYIIDLHQKVGFPSEAICFEVTESAAVNNLVVGRELILRLQAYGFTFALDDFGKGFSSYSYLQNLPAEYIKIDGGFVKEMLSNKRDHEIVRSIHQISTVMGMKTIAEYVEDDEILEALREIGVDYAQGFGIQRPAELAEFKPVSEFLEQATRETEEIH
ncbi:EAL domain-containing protein [Catenovulum sp. 2E275]|uniref:EAL domain-containing protein n=1 Tax=Catenovulum sp. 2E275 TaxID=2980497 RepID=UPI0021D17DBF|nr:EAL domain-containing protein [Catenovulum sp. 2E275]MCU4676806.1 EAL domain-containing protein [Catenovulum sp. 2E275]